MSEVLYATVLQSLMSSFGSTDNLIKKAATPKKFAKASSTLADLSITIDALAEFDSSSKRDRKFTAQRKPARYLANTIRSLKDALENREISLTKFCELIRTEVSDRLQDLKDSAQTHIKRIEQNPDLLMEVSDDEVGHARFVQAYQKVSGASKSKADPAEDYEEIADFSQAQYEFVTNRLSIHSQAVHKALVSKIKSDKLNFSRSAVIPTQCPVTVNFENVALRSTKLLRHIFTGVDALGFAGPDSSDVALILPDQILLQFSKSQSELMIANKHDDSKSADDVTKNKAAMKSEKSLLRKLLSDREKLSNRKEGAKRTGTLDSELRRKLDAELKEIQTKIDTSEKMILILKRHGVEAKSIYDSKARFLGKKTSNVYFERINQFLDDARSRGHEYSLMSNDFATSPTNSDISLAWIVPTPVYKKLYAQTKGNIKVLSWGLPLSNQSLGVSNGKQIARGKKSRRL